MNVQSINRIFYFAVILFTTIFACSSSHDNKTEEKTTDKIQENKNTVILIKTSLGDMKAILYDDTPIHKENFLKLINEDFYDGILFHRVIKDFMIQAGDPDSKTASPGQMLGTGGPSYTLEAEIKPNRFHQKGALAAARQGDNINPQRRSSGSQFYIVHGKVVDEHALKTDRNMLMHYFREFINDADNTLVREKVIALQNDKEYNQLEELLFSYKDTLEAKYSVELDNDYPEDRLKAYTTVGGAPHLDDQYTVFGQVTEGFDVIDKIGNAVTGAGDRPKEDIKILDIKIISE